MASKLPNDPSLTKETGRFLDGLARTADDLQTAIDAVEASIAALPALASQAEAEAGTDNVKYMSALRTSQAIAALAPPPMTLLASGAVGTGTTISYTGLAQCELFFIFFEGLSHNSGTNQSFGVAVSSNNGSSYGTSRAFTAASTPASLVSGSILISGVGQNGANKVIVGSYAAVAAIGGIVTDIVTTTTGITNALQFAPSAGNFDAGTIYIYGS